MYHIGHEAGMYFVFFDARSKRYTLRIFPSLLLAQHYVAFLNGGQKDSDLHTYLVHHDREGNRI